MLDNERQNLDFREYIIPFNILDDAVHWIVSNLPPEDVFSTDQLSEWALENEFVRLHPVEDED